MPVVYQNLKTSLKHTEHSKKRANQRGLSGAMLRSVLDYGTPFHRQGLIFYTILKEDLAKAFCPVIAKKLQNVVVVFNNATSQIVTCYKAKNAVRYLRKKGKKLYKNN